MKKKKLLTLGNILKDFLEKEYKDIEVDIWGKEPGASDEFSAALEQIRINLMYPLTTLAIIYPDSNEVFSITVRNTSNEPWARVELHPGDPEYVPRLKRIIDVARANRMKWHDMEGKP